jgi:Na+-transporting NADH:ubiquinone oxidoreductase subunit NqrA
MEENFSEKRRFVKESDPRHFMLTNNIMYCQFWAECISVAQHPTKKNQFHFISCYIAFLSLKRAWLGMFYSVSVSDIHFNVSN